MPQRENYEEQKKEAVYRYRAVLRQNLQTIEALRSGALSEEYPQLSAYATGRSTRSLFEKLDKLTRYFIEYGKDERQPVSYQRHAPRSQKRGRGVEMYISQRGAARYIDMETDAGRIEEAKKAWQVYFAKLQVLGLLQIYQPKMNPEDSRWNTREQQYSVEQALQRQADGDKDARPVNWFHIPKYGARTLKNAEKLVPVVKQLGYRCTDMDAVRYALADKYGTKKAIEMAREMFDDGKSKPTQDTERRITLLCAALVHEFSRNREWIAPGEGLFVALAYAEKAEWSWIRHTWRTHRDIILERCNVEYRRPTEAEKRRWRLKGNGYVLARVGTLPSDIPSLEELTAAKEPDAEDEIPF